MDEPEPLSERHLHPASRWFLLLCLIALTAALPVFFTTQALEAGAIRPLVSQMAVVGMVSRGGSVL